MTRKKAHSQARVQTGCTCHLWALLCRKAVFCRLHGPAAFILWVTDEVSSELTGTSPRGPTRTLQVCPSPPSPSAPDRAPVQGSQPRLMPTGTPPHDKGLPAPARGTGAALPYRGLTPASPRARRAAAAAGGTWCALLCRLPAPTGGAAVGRRERGAFTRPVARWPRGAGLPWTPVPCAALS